MNKKPLSQKAIADLAGVSRQTLNAWKRAGFDTSEANLPAIQEKAGKGKAATEIGKQIQAERLRKLKAEADRKEFDLECERRKYVLRSEAISDAAQAAVASKGAWESLSDAWPPILDGLSAARMKVRIRELAQEKCKELAECFGKL